MWLLGITDMLLCKHFADLVVTCRLFHTFNVSLLVWSLLLMFIYVEDRSDW